MNALMKVFAIGAVGGSGGGFEFCDIWIWNFFFEI
jgi:hypothetical protein